MQLMILKLRLHDGAVLFATNSSPPAPIHCQPPPPDLNPQMLRTELVQAISSDGAARIISLCWNTPETILHNNPSGSRSP